MGGEPIEEKGWGRGGGGGVLQAIDTMLMVGVHGAYWEARAAHARSGAH